MREVTITLEGDAGAVEEIKRRLESGCECDASMHDGEADAVEFKWGAATQERGSSHRKVSGTLSFHGEDDEIGEEGLGYEEDTEAAEDDEMSDLVERQIEWLRESSGMDAETQNNQAAWLRERGRL